MEELQRWFRQQSKRESRIVYLEDALIGHRFWAYAFYRLRFFFARLGMESVLRIIRFLFIYYTFLPGEFVALALLFAATELAGSFWWGLLELMRGRVRQLYRTGKAYQIPREVGRWLSLSIQLALIVLGLSCLYATWLVKYKGHEFSAADLYALSILLGLGLNIITRCYHSGIYAIRRIYRPALAIVIVELLSFVVILALWPWLGSWSLPAATLAVSLVGAWLTFAYARRLYRFFDFAPLRFVRLRRVATPFRGSFRDAFVTGLSHMVTSMDALLILSFAYGSQNNGSNGMLFALFFVAGPIFRAGSEWAQLFYFDLKKLEIKPFRNLRRRFESGMIQLALAMAFILWVLLGIVGVIGFPALVSENYWLLILLLVSRSLLSAAQVQAFSDRSYGELLRSSASLLVGIALAGIIGEEYQKIILLTLVMFVVFFVLNRRQEALENESESRQVVGPVHWLARLRGISTPVRVAGVRLYAGSHFLRQQSPLEWEEENRRKCQQLAERIAARLGGSGSVAVVGRSRIVWYEHADATAKIEEDWLMRQGGGLLEAVQRLDVQDDGVAALTVAQVLNFFGKDLLGKGKFGSRLTHVTSVGDVHDTFLHMFPNGIIIDLCHAPPQALCTLSAQERRRIVLDAAAFAGDSKQRTGRSRFETTALVVNQELRSIFLVQRGTDSRLRLEWRGSLRRLNLQAALDAVVIRNEAPALGVVHP